MTMLAQIRAMKTSGDKIAVLTCYDASFAVLMEQAGVDVLLVGDSLGMVLQGSTDTLGVTMQDMQYHTRCVAKGAKTSLIVADLPVGSDRTPEQALENAKLLLAAGAHVIKLEGGKIDVVRHLVANGIAVCGHLGFTPQSVRELGGYKVQGKDEFGAQKILDDAFALQQAGACMLVLEMVPAALARHITAELAIPTIGIGAGAGCDGQVLVLQDMLGIYPGKTPKFARNFMLGSDSIQAALVEYVKSVKDGSFPAAKHSF
jgi:3-methyl-2-oxobutanoate hydroxymethyltransferase